MGWATGADQNVMYCGTSNWWHGKGWRWAFKVENVSCPEHGMLEKVCFFETLRKNEFVCDGSSVR